MRSEFSLMSLVMFSFSPVVQLLFFPAHASNTIYNPMNIYTTLVWLLRAPCWYIGPTAMPKAVGMPIAPEQGEGTIGRERHPKHCRKDDIPAWWSNKITLLALLPFVPTLWRRCINLLMLFGPVRGVNLIPETICKSPLCWQIISRVDLTEVPPNNGHLDLGWYLSWPR